MYFLLQNSPDDCTIPSYSLAGIDLQELRRTSADDRKFIRVLTRKIYSIFERAPEVNVMGLNAQAIHQSQEEAFRHALQGSTAGLTTLPSPELSGHTEPCNNIQVPVDVHVSARRPLITPIDDHTSLNF